MTKVITKKKVIQKTGRPSKYHPFQTLKKTRQYIDSCQIKEVRKVKTESASGTSYALHTRPNYPTIRGLAKKLSVTKSTLYEWRDRYGEFALLLEEIVDLQEERLLELGLSREIDPGLTKFILSARHNYREKSDHRIETAASLFADLDDE